MNRLRYLEIGGYFFLANAFVWNIFYFVDVFFSNLSETQRLIDVVWMLGSAILAVAFFTYIKICRIKTLLDDEAIEKITDNVITRLAKDEAKKRGITVKVMEKGVKADEDKKRMVN
ncbi:MAG: hypothetical protein AABY22_17730 [Nanoarchaeota archaeon]